MPRLSLTDLVDIVQRSGTSKITKVAQLKHRGPYSPATDFYRPLREEICEVHRAGHPRSRLSALFPSLVDAKKRANYPPAIAGYRRWWGRKALSWFDPPSSQFSHAGFVVSINPELGLEINGTPHIIKLYFKGNPLTRTQVEITNHLMEFQLRPLCHNSEVIGILDIRQSRLITAMPPTPTLTAAIRGELDYVASLWPAV